MNNTSLILPYLYEALHYEIKIDRVDWAIVTRFAETGNYQWQMPC